MELFRALVETQDGEMPVTQSRRAVAERFGVSEAQVRVIEREGLDGNWSPLWETPASDRMPRSCVAESGYLLRGQAVRMGDCMEGKHGGA